MKTLHFLPLLACALLLGACSKNVILDNPGIGTVVFTIDSEKYELAPGSSQGIRVGEGKHTIHVQGNGVETRDTAINLREGGILHSGVSTYLVWRQLYGIQTERATLLNEDWVEFDSAKAYGDFKVFPKEQIYIEKTWDHGLDEELPTSKTLMISKDFAVEGKIFRAKDFLETYRKMQSEAQ
jgi:hypothetical protein